MWAELVAFPRHSRPPLSTRAARRDWPIFGCPTCAVQTKADCVKRVNIYPLCEPRFVAQKTFQLGAKRICQGIEKVVRRTRESGLRVQETLLLGAGRRWSCQCRLIRIHARDRHMMLHPLPLFWMKENRPLLPREIERALQLLYICHHPEAALGIGMVERIHGHHRRLGRTGLASRRQFQQCLRRFSRNVVCQG